MFKTGDRVVWIDEDGNAFHGVVWDVDYDRNPKQPYLLRYKVAGRTYTVWPKETMIYVHRNFEE